MEIDRRSQEATTTSYTKSRNKTSAENFANNNIPANTRVYVKQEPEEGNFRDHLYPPVVSSVSDESGIVEAKLCIAEEEAEPPDTKEDVGSPIILQMELSTIEDADSETAKSSESEVNDQQGERKSYGSNKNSLHLMIFLVVDEEDCNNLFCKKCHRSFSRKDTYRQHMRMIHKIILTPCTTIQHPIILIPDKDDPNFNCKVCEKTFNQRASYRYHLETEHGIACTRATVKPRRYFLPGQQGPHTPATYCSKCHKTFDLKQNYLHHMKRAHNLIPILNQENTPDEDDPNFYCKACEKTFNQKPSYRLHLRKFHEMKLKSSRRVVRNSELLPDTNDPNKYCKVCDRTYSSNDSFANHMRRIHRLESLPRRKHQSSLYLLSTILLESTGLKIT
jgi:uncharacterized C2H2 Zn-finger protein